MNVLSMYNKVFTEGNKIQNMSDIKIPKNSKELAGEMPHKAKEIKEFIDKNKIKLSKEEDLVKLAKQKMLKLFTL